MHLSTYLDLFIHLLHFRQWKGSISRSTYLSISADLLTYPACICLSVYLPICSPSSPSIEPLYLSVYLSPTYLIYLCMLQPLAVFVHLSFHLGHLSDAIGLSNLATCPSLYPEFLRLDHLWRKEHVRISMRRERAGYCSQNHPALVCMASKDK